MSTDRQQFRNKVYFTYRTWSAALKSFVVTCPWCEEPITGDFHVHEWLVKRSGVNKRDQHLIMAVENTVPLHPECHADHGHDVEMSHRCLNYTASQLGPDRIAQWYISLWQEYNLSVKKGLLRQSHEIPMYLARALFDQGAQLLDDGRLLPITWDHPYLKDVDVRDCAFAQFVREKNTTHRYLARGLEQFHGLSPGLMVDFARAGYWLHYLRGVIG